MIPDAEVISLLCTILTKLDVGEFTVKVSITCKQPMSHPMSNCPGQPSQNLGWDLRGVRCSGGEDSYNLFGCG